MNDEITMAKRRLGTSHWDRKLVANMTALSVSDNFEDAHREWIATGDVWWRGNGEVPAWIANNDHPNECLCGHKIVYHFRIQNTENGNEEVVGSDHINSYLIIRAISKETGMQANEITEELIQKWLNVRVKGMKAEAWWEANGEAFERMFNTVKDADVRYNTRIKEWVWDSETNGTRPSLELIKKRGAGEEMASIVWRWNHPDNSRAQINSRGYPNDALMHDLSMFYVKCLTGLNEKLQAEKDARARAIASRQEQLRLQRLRRVEAAQRAAEERERKRLEEEAYRKKMQPIWDEQQRVAQAEHEERQRRIRQQALMREEQERNDDIAYLKTHGSKSDEMLEYYGLEPVNWERAHLLDYQEIRTLKRYLATIKKLEGSAIRRIAQITEKLGEEE